MQNFDSQTIQLAILAVVALAVLLQAIMMLAIFVTLRKATRSMKEEIEDLRSSVMPIITNTRELFVRVAPRIEETAADLAAVAHGLRTQTADVQSSATEILERLGRQTARLDAMISSVFDTVDQASGLVTVAVAKPMRQLSGILAAAKAIIESLRNSAAEPRHHAPAPPPLGDKDMFD
jgi:uncharacterized protein YoxC